MHKQIKFVALLLLIILFILSVKYVSAKYSADVNAEKADNFLDAGDYNLAESYASKSIRQNPLEPRYYLTRARIYIALLAGEDTPVIRTYKLLALQDMRTALALNPNNLMTVKGLIPLYYFISTNDVTLPASSSNVDMDFLDIVALYYSKIFEISPNDVGVYTLLYKYSTRLGLVELRNASEEKIKNLRPDLLEWYVSE